MMRIIIRLFVGYMVFIGLIPIASHAGEPDEFPTDPQAFENKLRAHIQPGSPLQNAVDFLQRNEFRCADNTALGHTFYCVRHHGGAMSSRETVHEVWLEYNAEKKITRVLSGVTVLPGISR